MPTKTQLSAGIIIYRPTPEGPKFLLLYHGHNYWNFPKGKMEGFERKIETALREVREETGLKSHELKLKKNFRISERFSFCDRIYKDKIFKIVTFYLAETSQHRIIISPGGHEEGYGWFLYSEARRILSRYKSTQEILRQANSIITKEINPTKLPAPNNPPHTKRKPQKSKTNNFSSHPNPTNRHVPRDGKL